MKAKELLKQNIKAMHDDLLLGYERTQSYPSSVIGAERELLIEKLLSIALPPTTRFGSGVIIDHTGRSTGQVDLIIESPMSMSFPVSSANQRLYFANSVLAAFEVKSNLSSQKKEAFNKVEEITSLWTNKYDPETLSEEDRIINKQDYEVPSFIVAYKGATKKTVHKWLREECIDKGRRFPTGILCIEPGYFFGFTPDGGPNLEAEGCYSIYAFLCCLNSWLKESANKTVNDSLFIDLINNS
ncbi:hypothetical protein BT049_RS23595 [Vibrio parahaemolyticus]|nr:hypothetical protein [Vibrio parahaemolyticus]ELA7163828.1 hypothetical protein [Vibrio parahaemolyticus]MDG3001962.1 hypothetical protein [Vibrio parahaemolyticus]MDG3039495.1 hypothetical protein [Vibrio parahaemolyticus]